MADVDLPQPRTKRRKRWWLLLIVLLVVGAAVAAGVSRKKEKPIFVTTEKAFRKDVTELVTATGKIQPEVEVKISPEVAGEIVEIPVKEGQVVAKGDLLLRIKPDSYRAQVEEMEAALSGARAMSERNKAELAKATRDYERAQRLYAGGLLAEAENAAQRTGTEIAKAALESSLFEIQRAESALRQIREALSKTTIYAPSAGSISSLSSRVGERVVGTSQFAGTEVMRLADLDHMEARVDVNENDVVHVKVGDAAKIHVDAYPDRTIDGVVREIASTATTNNAGTQEQVTNFEVKIQILLDPTVPLRPGMSATADIETATVADAVVVPIQSVTVRSAGETLSPEEVERNASRIQEREGGDNRAEVTNEQQQRQKARSDREKLQRVVFVKTGETVAMKVVETGISDPAYMEIKKGVEPGDEVVSGSYSAISRKLKDGAKVEIEKEAE